MARRGRRGKGHDATGAATGMNSGNAPRTEGTGADSRQAKNMAPKPAAHNRPPETPLDIAGARRATPSAQGILVNITNSPNRPPRGLRKPRGPRGDPRNLLYANDERLWDPSKGTKMTPKQSPTESQRSHHPYVFTTPVKGTNKVGGLKMDNNGENIPTSTGTINRSGGSPPQKLLEMNYIVEDTYDPDSFDRGRTVHRKTSPRPNHRERPRRERERQGELQREQNLVREKNHWETANIDDLAVQGRFQGAVRNIQEEQQIRKKNEGRFLEQPIPPPSYALLEFIANKNDELLGRFSHYPAVASGHHDRNVHPRSAMGGQYQMEDEEEDSLDAFFMSLHKKHAISTLILSCNVNFAGMGAQFS